MDKNHDLDKKDDMRAELAFVWRAIKFVWRLINKLTPNRAILVLLLVGVWIQVFQNFSIQNDIMWIDRSTGTSQSLLKAIHKDIDQFFMETFNRRPSH